MCGICGRFNYLGDQPTSTDEIARMCGIISHRGPNDDGFYIDGVVALAMRRLSVIDLESGAQPMFNEDGNIVIVFNGEIYNFKELRADLVRRGHQFVSQSDSEVIVHLYEEVGIEFPTYLNGMFSIALWDKKNERLVLARDRFGEKPLYFANIKQSVIFGSELKCLLQCADVPSTLDHDAVYHYFTLGYVPHPMSVYSSVRQLPPGGRLIVERGHEPQVDKYWTLASKIVHDINPKHAAECLREMLSESVRLRMVSDVPLGAFLSGGLDSSIIVALMAKHSAAQIKTFHVDFGEPDKSESEFARMMARRYSTEHHEIVVRPSAIEVMDRLIHSFDEPFADSSAIPSYYLSELTRRHVTVALAGDGGDEAFGGYRNYQRILARRRWNPMCRGIFGVVGRAIHTLLPRMAPGRRFFRSLGMDRFEAFAVGASELETREILSNEFLATVMTSSTFELLRPDLERGDSTDALAPFTYLDALRYMPDDILTKVDRTSMAHSLEVRSPFLDHNVFEFASSLPLHEKIRGGDTKVILKRAFFDDLPNAILQPRKRGFSLPMDRWLRTELREMLEDCLNDSAVEATGMFKLNELRSLAQEHWQCRRDRSHLLWRFVYFVRWLSATNCSARLEPLTTVQT